MDASWYKGVVKQGDRVGRTIGFPTINLDPTLIPATTQQGVYACFVRVNDKQYKGALYFGPRLVLNEQKIVLEIFILDFDQEIYGKSVSFQLQKFIRGVLNFPSFEHFQQQLHQDIEDVRNALP